MTPDHDRLAAVGADDLAAKLMAARTAADRKQAEADTLLAWIDDLRKSGCCDRVARMLAALDEHELTVEGCICALTAARYCGEPARAARNEFHARVAVRLRAEHPMNAEYILRFVTPS